MKIYSVNDDDIQRPDPCLGPTITAHSHSFESDFKDDHHFQRPFNWLGTFKARHSLFTTFCPPLDFVMCSTWLTPLLLSTMPHDSNESSKLFFHTSYGKNWETISQISDMPSSWPIPILEPFWTLFKKPLAQPSPPLLFSTFGRMFCQFYAFAIGFYEFCSFLTFDPPIFNNVKKTASLIFKSWFWTIVAFPIYGM